MSASHGRNGRPWRRLHATQRAKHAPCWLCGQAINYNAEPRDPDSFSVDHVKPLSTHPHLAQEPSNLRSAHLRCNQSRGAAAPTATIGATTQAW